MKTTNILLSILIILSLIIIYRLFTLDATSLAITRTVEKAKEDKRPFNMAAQELEKLSSLQLSESATSEDVKQYIISIYEMSCTKNGWSDNIPEIAKLSKIDSKFIPILLDFYQVGNSHRFAYALSAAIKSIIKDNQRNLLIGRLDACKELIGIVMAKGWVEDAKNILFKSIRHRDAYYPIEWVNAAAKVADSSIYADLKFYLLNGVNKYWTFEAIDNLPKIDLTREVDSLWNNKDKLGLFGKFEMVDLAKMAIIYGHQDALELLIRKLHAPEEESWGIEGVLRNYIAIPGDEDNIAKWYRKNKSNLKYDRASQKWLLTAAG
jgi:hypothetical protein